MSAMPSPLVSVVLTHYNKGPLIERTVESLLAPPLRVAEIVIVDDASTLPAWQETRARLLKNPIVHIIDNHENLGPAVRLNQGLELVQHDTVFMMDGDDVVGAGVLAEMLEEMRSRQADLVYGKVLKISHRDTAWKTPQAKGDYLDSSRPLDFMLQHNTIQMCVLCSVAVVRRAGGCDTGVFIQDESLALRLSHAASHILYRKQASVFVLLDDDETANSRAGHRLSNNLNQQHHDSFQTLLRFYQVQQSALTPEQQNLLARKIVSCYWKSRRYTHRRTPLDFILYLFSRLASRPALRFAIHAMNVYFNALPQVRHPAELP